MTDHILILVVVMLMAGIFGGLVTFYLHSQHDPDAASLPRCLVVGLGASFLVPVVLDVLNSDLILESQGDPSKLLIYTGFCLISALLSRFFIVNMSDRILSEAHVAKERSENVQQDLRLIKNELLPLIDTETERESESEFDVVHAEDVDDSSENVLRCLANGRYIFRSLPGLCKETNTDESAMLKTLNIMVRKNLAGKISGKKGLRWHITEKGRQCLSVE